MHNISPEVFSITHEKMFPLGKVYLFEGDTLNTVVLHYLKNISTEELIKEYDNLYLKIGSLYFSDDLKYYWEIRKHSSNKFPIAVYKLVEKNKLPKEVKYIYDAKINKKDKENTGQGKGPFFR